MSSSDHPVAKIRILDSTIDCSCGVPSKCPYCRRIKGVGNLPAEEREESTQFDKVLWKNDQVALVPTLGMITPGYFLVVDRQHKTNFSHHSHASLIALESSLDHLVRRLGAVFGEYLIFEHGPDRSNCGGGGCVSHAHMHLIPCSKQLQRRLLEQFQWNALLGLSDIERIRAGAYMLAGFEGTFHLASAPQVQSQWIRRQLVATIRGPRHWDWKIDPGTAELETTLQEFNQVDLTKPSRQNL